MQHLDEGTIHSWLDGALSADEAARVELHVASCETCSDAVAEARGLIAASSRILTALDDVPRVAGARGGRRDRGARAASFERWRIAAVIALVVGGGALALAVRRDAIPTVALRTTPDSGSELALVTIDSPAAERAEPTAPPNVEGTARVRGAVPGRGGVGAVTGGTPAQATARERDLAGNAPADAVPLTLAQVEVGAPAAPPSAAPARTDDTARLTVDVAAASRLTPDARQAEGRSPVAEKFADALGSRRSGAEASARLAEPVAPQARLRAAAEPSAPRPLTEERMVEDGRVVVRRVYRVEETLVTLDERAPPEREQSEQLQRLEERLRRVERAAEAAPRVDSTTTSITTIRWVDARGTEFTLAGPVPREQLERLRKLLGY